MLTSACVQLRRAFKHTRVQVIQPHLREGPHRDVGPADAAVQFPQLEAARLLCISAAAMFSTSSSTAAVAGQQQQKFIPSIAEGLRLVQSAGQELRTMDFVELIDRIITVFDHLGPVLVFAKQDMHTKAESLRQAAPTHPKLQDIVKADKAAGILTQKNSRARNLHRLTAVLHFMRLLLSKLLEAPTISVKVRPPLKRCDHL